MTWNTSAEPVVAPGLRNTWQVSPSLYRGARPTREGLAHLKALGVKTVVSLQSFHREGAAVRAAGMDYVHITMKPWHPETKEVQAFFNVVRDPARQPVFVHCYHGSDRTGLMTAIYRVECEGWGVAEAETEMVSGPFGFHPQWKRLVGYLRNKGWTKE